MLPRREAFPFKDVVDLGEECLQVKHERLGRALEMPFERSVEHFRLFRSAASALLDPAIDVAGGGRRNLDGHSMSSYRGHARLSSMMIGVLDDTQVGLYRTRYGYEENRPEISRHQERQRC